MIIDRYLIREISKPMLVLSAILVIIFVGASAAEYLADASTGMFFTREVMELIFLRMLITLDLLIPIALYLAVVGGLGRLYADSEIIALEAAGVSQWRILWPVFVLSLACALLVGYLSVVVRPWAHQESYRVQAQAMIRFSFENLEAGRFYVSPESQRTIFVDNVSHRKGRLEGVFLSSESGDRVQIIYAASAWQRRSAADLEPALVFERGYYYDLDRHSNRDVTIAFGELALRLDSGGIQPFGSRRKTISTWTLAASDDLRDVAELQWRLSRPLATLLLGLLAVPLSRVTPRQGKYARMLLAIVIYAVYYNLSALARTWLDKGKVDALPGLWWVDALVALLLLGLLLKQTWVFRKKLRTVRP